MSKALSLRSRVVQWVCVLTFMLPSFALAQAQPEREKLPDLQKSPDWHNKDYFSHATDPEVARLLENVEANHLGKGFQGYLARREYYWALDDLRYVLRVFPNHPRALELMGVVAQLTKSQSTPLPWFERALELFPRHAITRAQFGKYLAQIGMLNPAIAELEQAVAQEPTLAAAHAWLAEARARHGDVEVARQAARKARELGYTGKISVQ